MDSNGNIFLLQNKLFIYADSEHVVLVTDFLFSKYFNRFTLYDVDVESTPWIQLASCVSSV